MVLQPVFGPWSPHHQNLQTNEFLWSEGDSPMPDLQIGESERLCLHLIQNLSSMGISYY